MTKMVFDQATSHTVEDGGAAHTLELDTQHGSEYGMFVRLQSWDTRLHHDEMMTLVNALEDGKRVRVTVEIVYDV